jgi:hypothetical protein
MRKTFLILSGAFAVFALASAAHAQEAYTINATAAQVVIVDWARVDFNQSACVSAGLPPTCTTAQIQAVPGWGSTVIYVNTLAGRHDFIFDKWITPSFLAAVANRNRRDMSAFCVWWNGQTRGNQDTYCTGTFGLAAGCILCQ